MAISKNVCPECLKGLYTGNHEVITYGGRLWHKDCLEKLQTNVTQDNDKAMFQKLNRAFNKLS